MVTAAFLTGGMAIITHLWWLLWTCIGIVVLAVPAGEMIGIMDDTIAWGSTRSATHDPPADPQGDPRQPARFCRPCRDHLPDHRLE